MSLTIDELFNEIEKECPSFCESDRVNGESFQSLTYKYRYDSATFHIELVDTMGGAEGEGEYMHLIFKITNRASGDEYYIGFYGIYNSWDYNEWTEVKLVLPIEKTIIVYE